MKLPKIDLSSLPDLHQVTHTLVGMFGSGRTGPGHDDTIVVLATIVYESQTPTNGFF